MDPTDPMDLEDFKTPWTHRTFGPHNPSNLGSCPVPHMTYLKLSNKRITIIFTQNDNFDHFEGNIRGVIKGKAGKHLPYPNFETLFIL